MGGPHNSRRSVAVARAIAKRRSLILLYHGLGEPGAGNDPSFLQVPPQVFRAQLETLLEAGFKLLSVSELARLAGDGDPPPGFAALSFDDGMEDNHSVLLPVLGEYGLTATIYVQTGTIGDPNPWMPGARVRMMTEDEIRSVSAAGVEIGAHSVTHPDMSRLDYDGCLGEMTRSKDELERITGTEVRTFAYPYGHYGPEAVAAARDAGFETAVTCVRRGSWSPFELNRTLVTGRDGLGTFMLRIAGVYEPLALGPAGAVVGRLKRTLRRR